MAGGATERSALYTTIQSQPTIVGSVLQDAADSAERAATLLAGAGRVFLVGTGTSSHAAMVGEHLLRAAGAEAYATTNFDFVTYPRPLRPDDALIAISHRGSKRFGAQAIRRGCEELTAARVVGLTGQGSPMEGPGLVIATAPQERSATHTASYTANLTALALVAVRLGEGTGHTTNALPAALERMPDTIAALLRREEVVRHAAAILADRGRLVLAGAGPNAATAREGALKVKESSYLIAEGFELETILHGGLQAVEPGDLAVVLAALGPAVERTADVLRALRRIGARLLLVADERTVSALAEADDPATLLVTYPAVPEPLSPLPAVIPLQLLAALTAELRGTNPDSFRADDPIYRRANESYPL